MAQGVAPQSLVFQEEDHRVIINIESAPLQGLFSKRDSFYQGIFDEWVAETHHPGFTGACYYRWGGQDVKWNPGCGILRYDFNIHTAGSYQISIRNRHDNAHDSTESNDAFMRVDGGQWWKTKSKIHRQWTWDTWYERSHDPMKNERCIHFFAAGRHVVEICGRSNSFCIDRILIAALGAGGEDPNLPPSSRAPA